MSELRSIPSTARCGTAAPDFPSPATAFYTAFRDATVGVRFATIADDEFEVTRVAAAFRTAGTQAETWCRENLGWDGEAAGYLAQVFALATGGWLLIGSGDLEVLERELCLAWRAFGEAHLH
jgi:hypothetical protein